MKRLLLLASLAFCWLNNFAVCPGGQVEVTITVKTDDYGKEGYWQLLPAGNTCGTGTLFEGGNVAVGCNGGGQQNNINGGYGNNLTITEGPWCLTQGSSYDIIFVDDYGDGGEVFTVNINGYPVYAGLRGNGAGAGSRFTFVANPPVASDLGCWVIKAAPYVTIGNVNLKAWIVNRGTDTIHSLDLFYSIDHAAVQTTAVSGLNISPFDSTIVSSTIPWSVTATGSYGIQMGAVNPNGNADMNSSNDTAYKLIEAGPAVPVIIDEYLTSTPILTVIGTSADSLNVPRDLDFFPVLTKNELWVLLKGSSLGGGSTVKFSHAGEPGETSLWQKDDNSTHFMDLPTAIAFSENTNFATSPGVFDANHSGTGSPFTGPSLWSSDTAIYTHTPIGGNGSHIDMLHQSPYSMGICSEDENIFWVFDDNDHDIVRYDFVLDHGPGNSDHSDGIVRRFEGMNLAGDPTHDVPSHLALKNETGMLYIVDTDNDRILKMDIHSGTFTSNLTPYEPVAEYSTWSNVSWSVVVDSGLSQPCGIDLIDNRIIVSDYATGDIIIYDNSSNTVVEMGRIHTGTPGIMGIKIGPDGKIWYVNALTNEVIRIDGSTLGINQPTTNNFVVYPNPASSGIKILLNGNANSERDLTISDARGSVVMSKNIFTGEKEISLDVSDFAAGVYTISLIGSNSITIKKFVKQ